MSGDTIYGSIQNNENLLEVDRVKLKLNDGTESKYEVSDIASVQGENIGSFVRASSVTELSDFFSDQEVLLRLLLDGDVRVLKSILLQPVDINADRRKAAKQTFYYAIEGASVKVIGSKNDIIAYAKAHSACAEGAVPGSFNDLAVMNFFSAVGDCKNLNSQRYPTEFEKDNKFQLQVFLGISNYQWRGKFAGLQFTEFDRFNRVRFGAGGRYKVGRRFYVPFWLSYGKYRGAGTTNLNVEAPFRNAGDVLSSNETANITYVAPAVGLGFNVMENAKLALSVFGGLSYKIKLSGDYDISLVRVIPVMTPNNEPAADLIQVRARSEDAVPGIGELLEIKNLNSVFGGVELRTKTSGRFAPFARLQFDASASLSLTYEHAYNEYSFLLGSYF